MSKARSAGNGRANTWGCVLSRTNASRTTQANAIVSAPDSCQSACPELQILVRREIEARHRVGEDVLDARAHAGRESEMVDRRVQALVVHDALDLVEHCLALLLVELLRLALEEVVDLGQPAVAQRAGRGHEGLEARGRVAADPADRQHDAAQLLL